MMKNKLFVLALIAVLMTVGLFVACRPGCEGNGTCEVKDGKGGYCSNYGYTIKADGSYNFTGCEVYKAASQGKDGKCDC